MQVPKTQFGKNHTHLEAFEPSNRGTRRKVISQRGIEDSLVPTRLKLCRYPYLGFLGPTAPLLDLFKLIWQLIEGNGEIREQRGLIRRIE